MSAPRKICVVTGSRADYGLLRWLMTEIAQDPALELQLVVTGSHLSPRFGETWREIEDDGLAIDERVELNLDDDSPAAVAGAMGTALSGLARALDRLAPHLVVVQGDRYEALAAAEAALFLRIPVAHTHGGEVTSGAIDDAMRHATTKMAHLHFTACEDYARRVVQLGEDPARVFNVGALGLEAIANAERIGREDLAEELGLALTDPIFLVTYHPATLAERANEDVLGDLLGALDNFADATVVFTGVNADPGNQAISAGIRRWVEQNRQRACYRDSLGQTRYLSLMAEAALVIGNSSSGIIEAPAVGVATVNLGERQAGRLRAASIIDCGETVEEIRAAIARALGADFQAGLATLVPVYGAGGTAGRICRVLRETDLAGLVQKSFRDLPAVA